MWAIQNEDQWNNFTSYIYKKKGKEVCTAHYIRECVLDTTFKRLYEGRVLGHICGARRSIAAQAMRQVTAENPAQQAL